MGTKNESKKPQASTEPTQLTLCASAFGYYPRAWCLRRPGEGAASPGTGASGVVTCMVDAETQPQVLCRRSKRSETMEPPLQALLGHFHHHSQGRG